ncbi:MAG: hypothetical protein H0W36_04140 [Gemmatimonadetes bacterium]|nr:hypothetical protein [Gemmatimonadota bacterium]
MSPATRKPAAKKPPAVAKAKAAENEQAGQPVTVDYHGLTLALPAKLPASLGLRLGKMQAASEDEQPGLVYSFLSRLISEQDLDRVMDRMDDLDEEDSLGDLVGTILGAYGGQPGE